MSLDSTKIKTVLFDLDGTLIDHFMVIYRCYRYAQEALGLEPASFEKVKATVGGSVPVTMAKLVGEEVAEEAVRLFREHFDEIMFEDLHALPGSTELLNILHSQGLQLAIFTNKRGEPSRAISTHLGWDDYLAKVIGTGDTPHRKPEEAFTQYVLDTLNASPESTIMIGDSPFDVAAAHARSLPCYCVATGSHTVEQLKNDPSNPEGVYPSLIELASDVFNIEIACPS